MSLSKADFDRYQDALKRIDSSSAAALEKALASAWRRGGKSSRSALKKITVDIAADIADQYGLAAGEVSAALWEDIYYNDTGSRLEALLPNMEDYYDEYFGDAAQAMVEKYMDKDDTKAAMRFLANITSKAVWEWARRTQTHNTERVVRRGYKGADEARFARVPQGADPCAWCLMLASRGFVYLSEWTAEHRASDGDLYHSCCRCIAISSFDSDPRLEGYDPDKYKDMYTSATVLDDKGRVDLKETLHNMRQMYGLK